MIVCMFVTSAKEVMFSVQFVFLCLFVSRIVGKLLARFS